jgi:hypothetical protein
MHSNLFAHKGVSPLSIEGTPAEKIYLVNQYDELGGLTPFLDPFS